MLALLGCQRTSNAGEQGYQHLLPLLERGFLVGLTGMQSVEESHHPADVDGGNAEILKVFPSVLEAGAKMSSFQNVIAFALATAVDRLDVPLEVWRTVGVIGADDYHDRHSNLLTAQQVFAAVLAVK